MLKAVRTMLIVLLNIVFYGLVVFGGVQLCRVGYSFACEAVGDTSKDLPPGQTKAFTISEDDGEFEVAKRLSNHDMQKGIYTLNSSMTYEEIIRVIYGL